VEKEENTTLEAQEKKDETAFQVTEEFLVIWKQKGKDSIFELKR